jgi:beta-mannosidase
MIEKLTHRSSVLEKIARCQIYDFLPPKNLAEYTWQSQVVQARRIKNAVEDFRAVKSFGCGCVLGSFKDFALAISPSVLDVQQSPKALYYYAQRFFAPILVSLLPDEETGLIRAFSVNDTRSPLTGILSCRMMNAAGDIVDTTEMPVRVSPFSRTGPINLPKAFTAPDDPSRSFLHVCIKDDSTVIAENTYFYGPDKHFKWPLADIDIEITPGKENNLWNVTLASETLIRDLQITPPQPADLSDNLLTLLPNEPNQIQIAYKDTAPSIQTTIKLLSANQSLNPY